MRQGGRSKSLERFFSRPHPQENSCACKIRNRMEDMGTKPIMVPFIMTKEYKWPADWRTLGRDFQQVFRMSMVDIYDAQMSWIMQKFTIRIDVLDERLHMKYGQYEERGLSMEDIVREHYGPEGVELLNALI